MSTIGQLIDSTILYLSGFTSQQDRATYLAENLDADDLTFSVADASAITRGIAEIGDEIIQVDVVDRTNNTITLPPYGRGFRGTEAATMRPKRAYRSLAAVPAPYGQASRTGRHSCPVPRCVRSF